MAKSTPDLSNLTPSQRRCVEALYAHDGSRIAAADALGMNERSFRRRLEHAAAAGWDPADCPAPIIIRPKPKRQMVALDLFVLRDQLQPRTALDPEAVREYAEIYERGGPHAMEPLRAYLGDEGQINLTRGFTRLASAHLAKLAELPCDVYPAGSTEIEILEDSLSGNRHGRRLTNSDKRRALQLYHDQVAKRKWRPTREVADLIGCSHDTVAQFRKELTAPKQDPKAGPNDPIAPPHAGPKGSKTDPTPENIAATNCTSKIPEARGVPALTRFVLIDEVAYVEASSKLIAALHPTAFAMCYPDAKVGSYHELCNHVSGYQGIKVTLNGIPHILGGRDLERDPKTLELAKPASAPDTTPDDAEPEEITPDAVAPSSPEQPAPGRPVATPFDVVPPPALPPLADRRYAVEVVQIADLLDRHREWTGTTDELLALAMIVGMNCEPVAWTDEYIRTASGHFIDEVRAGVRDTLHEGASSRLPPIGTICALFGLDYDAVHILAQRMVPE